MDNICQWDGVSVLSKYLIKHKQSKVRDVEMSGHKIRLLITTLGASWQIVPELFSITNPHDYDFFCGSDYVRQFREDNSIQNVDELWIITTEGHRDLCKLESWADTWNCRLRIFVCKGVNNFVNESEIIKMRSFIYKIVLYGSEIASTMYLSLSGGRKTMSADMQEAGNLFGCDAMLHVVDVKKVPDEIKEDLLLTPPRNNFSEYYIPLKVNEKIAANLIVAGDTERISSNSYPLLFDTNERIHVLEEDCELEREIQRRKDHSSQIYTNFYKRINDSESHKRDLFRKLYFLHPDILQEIRNYKLGKDEKRDYRIIKKLPKVELHSHLGGVLSPSEIISVAQTEENYHVKEGSKASEKFFATIQYIFSFENKSEELEEKIYGKYSHQDSFYSIGIDEYQKLGDFQGSGLLQTKNTISKTLEIYAKNLIDHNVKYVEIRCSPYKYIKLGLTTKEVIDCMTETLKQFSKDLEYRFIYIIGRQSSKTEIKDAIDLIVELLNENSEFQEKLVGIDLAGNEGFTKPSELRDIFMPLLERCIKITIHAGETESVDSIWEAVYHLAADRIGHGLKLLDKPELLNRFIDKNIGVEMCPSSNNQIVGFNQDDRKYPLKDYMEKGLKVTINTDDQGISKTNLTEEFIVASRMCPGLTLWDCIVLIRNSLSIGFCDAITKNKLMHEFEDEIFTIITEEFAG